MKKLKRRISLRIALMSAAVLMLVALAGVFMAVSAEEDVSPSDVSSSDGGHVYVSEVVSPTQTNEAPENLGDPVITMTTEKNQGETITLEISGENIYIDYGDGIPIAYENDEEEIKGSIIKIYGEINCYFGCDNNQLTSITVSNTGLLYLSLQDNHLNSLDVSGCSSLRDIYCQNNDLTSLDVSGCVALEWLDCFNNQLTSLDVSDCEKLTWLKCSNNQITSLDVSLCPELWQLICHHNKLTSLDVTNNHKLEVIYCANNNLTDLAVSVGNGTPYDGNDSLCEVYISDNHLKFAKLYSLFELRNAYEYDYAPQTHVIPSSVKPGDSIDLSSEYSVDGTVTIFIWYDSDGNVVTPATANGGVFTFGDDAAGKTLVCKMTNEKLPDFKADRDVFLGYDDDLKEYIYETQDHRLTTTEVTIEAADPEDPEEPEDDNIPVNDNPFIDHVEREENTAITVEGEPAGFTGVQLIVSNIESNRKKSVLEAIKNYAKTFNVEEGNTALYEVELSKGGTKVVVTDGKIKVRIKYPDNLGRQSENYTFKLYHQKADGTIEEIPIQCKPDGIWFEATDFSPYALVWNAKSAGTPGTGESALLIGVMAGLLVLSLAGVGYVLYRRGKQTDA